MLSTGFTAAQQKDYMTLLTTNHAINMVVQMLTLNHTYVADHSARLLTGQVTIDNDADTTRALTMDLMDPLHQLKLDPDAPDDGSLFFTKMFKVSYGVLSPDRKRAYYIPVFCGPISEVSRTDATVTVTCLGKESMLTQNLWNSKTYKKGALKTNVIIDLLRNIGGETKYDIPARSDRLTKDWTVTKEMSAWASAKSLARGMGFQLFYDGRGVCRMRVQPGSSVYTFSDMGSLLTAPQPKYSIADAVNAVEVIGGVPKGAKTHVYYRVGAPAYHPMSRWKLARNGIPRDIPITISDDNLKTVAQCAARAKAELSAALVEAVDVSFDALPIPHLEEGDFCTVKNDNWTSPFRYNKATIPLVASSSSSVGYLKNVYHRSISGGSGGGGQVVKVKNTKKKKPKKKKRHR